MQTIITILIVLLAASYVAWKIFRFIKHPEDISCNPDKCSSCHYGSKDSCDFNKQ